MGLCKQAFFIALKRGVLYGTVQLFVLYIGVKGVKAEIGKYGISLG